MVYVWVGQWGRGRRLLTKLRIYVAIATVWLLNVWQRSRAVWAWSNPVLSVLVQRAGAWWEGPTTSLTFNVGTPPTGVG